MAFTKKKILKPNTLRAITAILLIAFLLNIPLYLASAAAYRKWSTDADGVIISNPAGNQEKGEIIRAFDGDFIIAFSDLRGADKDLYAQKIGSSGTVQWTANGVAITSATGDQPANNQYDIVSDENGGAILAWRDSRNTPNEIYIQNIDSNGTVQWTTNGFLITNSADGSSPALLSDGSGGAYLAWADSTSGNDDILMTHVTSSGALDASWNPPVTIANSSNTEKKPKLIFSDSSNIIINYLKTFVF